VNKDLNCIQKHFSQNLYIASVAILTIHIAKGMGVNFIKPPGTLCQGFVRKERIEKLCFCM
jgi:hypothetical protein